VPCDAAAWRLFGISLAGYNALISLALAALALWGIKARKAKA
jgi:disulfide bond formation protein DsbB